MKKLLLIMIISLFFVPLIYAQSAQKIHDLKGITDENGTVHLFYRIFKDFEDDSFQDNSIYHLNISSKTDSLFLEDFSNSVVDVTERINDVQFFENNPEKYIYTKDYCSSDCGGIISRFDKEEVFEGGLYSDFQFLKTTDTDNDTVFVKIGNHTIISSDGGMTWPTINEIDQAEGGESFILDFPLMFLNPNNKKMMFGIDSFNDGSGRVNHFVKTNDGGATSSIISDSIIPVSMGFDKNKHHVYLIDESDCLSVSNSNCIYHYFVSDQKGDSSSWNLKHHFNHLPEITVDSTTEGRMFLSQENELFESYDFGENFTFITSLDENITGIYKSEQDSLFISTEKSLYMLWNNQLTKLKEIPVSIERTSRNEIAKKIKLFQNYPNPFNPTTTIRFYLDTANKIELILLDINGRKIKSIVNSSYNSGFHELEFDASSLSSGIYIVLLKSNNKSTFQKISLIK